MSVERGKLDSEKFSRDLVWNVASLGISGVAGIVLNYLISEVYGSAALGSFNQVFAAYILFSQVAALGIHLSALQRIAVAEDSKTRQVIATTALIVTLIQASIVAGAFFLFSSVLSGLLQSPDVGTGVKAAAPAILFFALNKVMLGSLNGLRHMRAYAVLNASRFLLMLLAFWGCAISGVAAGYLPLVVSVAEGVILLGAIYATRSLISFVAWHDILKWGRGHLGFGARSFMSGVLSDLNTRVDVLMLGYFASDSLVGIYSFAAILAEGFFQLLMVLRSNFAPIIVQMFADGSSDRLLNLIRSTRTRVYLAALPLGILVVAGYALVVPLLTSDPSFGKSWVFFGILILGIVLSSGYMPFSQLLLLANRPGLHTWFMLTIVSTNIIANLILIPALGSLGAAIGTAGALVASTQVLRLLSRRVLKLAI